MRESGFTLVETVVAALVLAVGVLAVVGTQRAAEHLSSSSARLTAAVEEAASELDRLGTGCTDSSAAARLAIVHVPVAGESAGRAVHVEAIISCALP